MTKVLAKEERKEGTAKGSAATAVLPSFATRDGAAVPTWLRMAFSCNWGYATAALDAAQTRVLFRYTAYNASLLCDNF